MIACMTRRVWAPPARRSVPAACWPFGHQDPIKALPGDWATPVLAWTRFGCAPTERGAARDMSSGSRPAASKQVFAGSPTNTCLESLISHHFLPKAGGHLSEMYFGITSGCALRPFALAFEHLKKSPDSSRQISRKHREDRQQAVARPP